jgi:hypothetical protein
VAIFEIWTYEAAPSYGGGFSIALHIGGGEPLPVQKVSARNVAEALARLKAAAESAGALGKPLAVAMRLAKGERAPAGWRALKYRETTIPVNVPGVA